VKSSSTLLRTAVVTAGFCLLVVGCAGVSLPAPTPLDAQRIAGRFPHATLGELERGRSLYSKRCSSCHELFEPARFSAERWQKELVSMRDRAGLKDGEERLILQYLSAVRERPVTAAGTDKPKDQS
jgi:hypothetical protein